MIAERSLTMFLAWKEIKKEKLRFMMIILVTFLIAYLVYFLTGLAYGLASANTTSVEKWDAKGIVLSEGANQNIYASTIDQKVVDQLSLSKSESINIASTVVSVNKEKKQHDLILMGIEDDSRLVLPKIVEGKSIKKENDILLSVGFKKEENVRIGDTIKLVGNGREFHIVGFTEKSEYNTKTVGYVPLEMASQEMMLYQNKDGKTDTLTGSTPNIPKRVSAVLVNQKLSEKELEKNHLDYLTMSEFINKIPGYQAQILTFGLMIVSLILISAVIISIFMYILTMQKKSVFAILKIQGISNLYISRSVIFQTLIVSLSGIILGIGLTLLTFHFLSNQVPVAMNWQFTGVISVLFLFCSLLGSLFSARSILKIDPLDAL